MFINDNDWKRRRAEGTRRRSPCHSQGREGGGAVVMCMSEGDSDRQGEGV